MNGRNTFTKMEANAIRTLINEKVNATPIRQREIRGRIRRLGFYYTDYRQDRVPGGYTVKDFNDLIEEGLIKVY